MVLEKTQEKIRQLEAAIKHLDSVIKHLGHNAGEIKSQIHTSMSRHLEAMRNREVWLLGQVDLVVSTKEEVLHHQQVRLNKALGVLQSSLGLAESDDDGLDSRLASTLDKLDITDLKPEETPYITFRADQSALRESIITYGRVDATGFPLQSAFVAHGHPSASLPRHFEEYEDADHHVFYKTVEEVNRVRTASSHISVNIPKLSKRPEDWLCRPTTVTTSTTSAPRFSFPSLSPNVSDWIRCEPVAPTPPAETLVGDASIQNWLTQIKQYPDLEEEEFEIIDRDAVSSSKSGSSYTVFPVLRKPPTVSMSQKLGYPSPVEAWLKSSCVAEDKEAMDFFKHISTDRENWLIKSMKKESDSCTDCFCYPKRTEIENLGNVTCGPPVFERFFREQSRDYQRWLKRTDVDNRSLDQLPASVCKANELCQTFEDCICQPNCGVQFIQRRDSSPQKWLKSAGGKNKVLPLPEVKGFERFFKSLDMEKEEWLKEGVEKIENENSALEKYPWFDHISSNPEDWLKEKQSARNKNCEVKFEFKHGKEDRNAWLKVAGTELTQSTTPLSCSAWDPIENYLGKMSTSDWLYKPRAAADAEDKDNGDEKDNGGGKWLITRRPSADKQGMTRISRVPSSLGECLQQQF